MLDRTQREARAGAEVVRGTSRPRSSARPLRRRARDAGRRRLEPDAGGSGDYYFTARSRAWPSGRPVNDRLDVRGPLLQGLAALIEEVVQVVDASRPCTAWLRHRSPLQCGRRGAWRGRSASCAGGRGASAARRRRGHLHALGASKRAAIAREATPSETALLPGLVDGRGNERRVPARRWIHGRADNGRRQRIPRDRPARASLLMLGRNRPRRFFEVDSVHSARVVADRAP